MTTPIASALKKYCIWGYLGVLTGVLNHFWIQVAFSLQNRRTAVSYIIETVTNL
jgi:hypothetical protein